MKKNIFTSERVVLLVILLNSVILFRQEIGPQSPAINVIDAACTIFFALEMLMKHIQLGFRGYWASGWNRMDGILVILSIPALISYFVPAHLLDLSILLILRVLRVFRLFRLAHIFPNFDNTIKGFGKALRDSFPIFCAFLILILMVSLFNCAFFKDVAPEYFGTPWDSIYSTFRLCTVEGWYEIPDALSVGLTPGKVAFVRIYFVLILIAGGIIGLSLVNSIFVDAMVSDNNDALELEVKQLNERIDLLTEEIRKLQNNQEKE
ncbi:MAG: ion transporter [Bacteroidales bacterium]|nr:ion transporter [Bacteroidales bacterium]